MLSTKYDLISLNQIQKWTSYSSVHTNWSSPKRPNKFLVTNVQYLWYRALVGHTFRIVQYKEKRSITTMQTQLYRCINQLHVSAVYSHHQAVPKILN
jgi:hypothetical protein